MAELGLHKGRRGSVLSKEACQRAEHEVFSVTSQQ